jgi:Ca2+-binding RTX toxin-like protein
MSLTIVDPSATDIEYTSAVSVKFSGVHIGGGIYFSANHDPQSGGSHTAIPQRSLDDEGESHSTIEYEYTLPADDSPWDDYRDDFATGTDYVKAGFDMSLQAGQRLSSTGEFYDGPAASLLIANDPNDLTGTVTITGYPSAANSENGLAGVLHETTGELLSNGYTEQDIDGDIGGYFTIYGASVVGGMSGSGNYLDYDADGDGVAETYLIGTASRVVTVTSSSGVTTYTQSASFSPHYADLADTIEGLTGDDARDADDFARMTMLSAQTLGSTNTTVQGEFFHEDIYGGVNADTLLGAGGNDYLFGAANNDSLNGGTGDDTLDGGTGKDTLTGDTGADTFRVTDGSNVIITDFSNSDGDIIDLSSYFSTLDAVIDAATEQSDGSLLITLPGTLSDGSVTIYDTTIDDLTRLNINIVCFCAGTTIRTQEGDRPIETLTVGDAITIYDGSTRILRAINRRILGQNELAVRPHLWPIKFTAGALGNNVPSKDLSVSPQHRILSNSPIAARMAGTPALIAAKEFLDIDGVSQPHPKGSITYFHLVFDQHQIVCANECWSESFFPGKQAMAALPLQIRQEYNEIFFSTESRLAATSIIKGKKAKKLIMRHIGNRKPVQNTAQHCQA